MNRVLTEKEKKWLKEFRSLLRRMPKNIEVILTDQNEMSVWERGSYDMHIGSKFDAFGMNENNLGFEGREHDFFHVAGSASIIPYTEGK